MSDILCVYYSRTGRTEKAMGEIARALDAELVKIEDGQDRSKLRGYLRSGMEAMSKKLCPIAPLQTQGGAAELIFHHTLSQAQGIFGVLNEFIPPEFIPRVIWPQGNLRQAHAL